MNVLTKKVIALIKKDEAKEEDTEVIELPCDITPYFMHVKLN